MLVNLVFTNTKNGEDPHFIFFVLLAVSDLPSWDI